MFVGQCYELFIYLTLSQMSVMTMRFMDLPKKRCFAGILERPTETSDATVSVHGESVQDESVAPDLCVGRRSLLPLLKNSRFFYHILLGQTHLFNNTLRLEDQSEREIEGLV